MRFVLRQVHRILVITFGLVAIDSPAALADWKAGVAKVAITPEKPMWLSGYGARMRPADGKLTELWAKALVLADNKGERAVLVTLDLVGIDRELSVRVCGEIMKRQKLARDRIALCCSHTHSGPVVGDNLRSMYFYDDAQDKLVNEYTAGARKENRRGRGRSGQEHQAGASWRGAWARRPSRSTAAITARRDVPKLRPTENSVGPSITTCPCWPYATNGTGSSAIVSRLRLPRNGAGRLPVVRRLARLCTDRARKAASRRDGPCTLPAAAATRTRCRGERSSWPRNMAEHSPRPSMKC